MATLVDQGEQPERVGIALARGRRQPVEHRLVSARQEVLDRPFDAPVKRLRAMRERDEEENADDDGAA